MLTKIILTSLLMIFLGGIAATILSDGFLTDEYFFDFSHKAFWFDKIMNIIVLIGIAGIIILIFSSFVAIWVS